jgi:phosphoglucomutase
MVRSGMILSASGWRDVFAADGDAESRLKEISGFHAFAAFAAAEVFADFIRANNGGRAPCVVVGLDTRPTGMAIAEQVLNALLAKDVRALFCGVTAAPEIMAYARSLGGEGGADGFIYISASHNPIGYNGIKFGLTDGGVLGGADMEMLKAELNKRISSRDADFPGGVKSGHLVLKEVLDKTPRYKNAALSAYTNFSLEVVSGGQTAVLTGLKDAIKAAPIGIAADFNGSARTMSIDKDFFENLGLKFRAINDKAGEIAHQIVPEGEALKPCLDFLTEIRWTDRDFLFAYAPDCDGDRGNIVFFDENSKSVRPLEAQEVFALACLAELCRLAWIGGPYIDENGGLQETAVAVNDATSMRIDSIARAFGARVFRAETGEANVVNLGQRLRAQGWTAPIMGEGAAGGSIVHPSAVRDPLQTVMALLKLLCIRSQAKRKGFFELWCERGCGKPYSNDFTLSDIIASLPAFTTTSAYSEEARLHIHGADHAAHKDRYQKIFVREWERQKNRLYAEWGISSWQAYIYKASEETRVGENFRDAGRGGLRIVFQGESGADRAAIWMRGSGTEPVFRVMADVEGVNPALHDELLAWQRGMVLTADDGR